jgi:hypothetical protein
MTEEQKKSTATAHQIKIRLATGSDFEQVGNIFSEENRYHAELMPEIFKRDKI